MPKFPKEYIVSDTGPLITLEKLSDGFSYIKKFYKRILVPQEVYDEFTPRTPVLPVEYNSILEIRKEMLNPAIPDTPKIHDEEKMALSLALTLNLGILLEESRAIKVGVKMPIAVGDLGTELIDAYKDDFIDYNEAHSRLLLLYGTGRFGLKQFNIWLDDLNDSKAVKEKVI